MGSKKLSISIQNPCQQAWHEMKPEEQGRYCMQCREVVRDYTGYSDRDLIDILGSSSASACGRFETRQLNRMIASAPTRSLPARLYKFFAGLLLFTASEPLIAQTKVKAPSANEQNDQKKPESTTPAPKENRIRGKVMEVVFKQPWPYALVRIKNTDCGTTTDESGEFNLLIPDSLLKENIILQVSSSGFDRIECTIKASDLPIVGKEFLLVANGEKQNIDITTGKMLIQDKK